MLAGTAGSDVTVIVIKSLLLDVLVLSCPNSVAHLDVSGSLLKCHRLHKAAKLVVVVACANGPLPYHHVDCLSDGSAALFPELVVDGADDLSLQ